jgi:hypothetical protein
VGRGGGGGGVGSQQQHWRKQDAAAALATDRCGRAGTPTLGVLPRCSTRTIVACLRACGAAVQQRERRSNQDVQSPRTAGTAPPLTDRLEGPLHKQTTRCSVSGKRGC